MVIAGLNHELDITFKTEFTAYRRGVLFLCFVSYHFLLLYFFPEGEDGGEGQLEMHQPPGDANDGDAEKRPAEHMHQRNLPPSQKNPKEIHDNGDAARLARAVHQLVPERPKHIGAQLEQLQTERDTNYRDAHQKPHDKIDDGYNKSTKNQPKTITERFHDLILYSIYQLQKIIVRPYVQLG